MKLLFAGDVFITKPDQFILEPSLQKFISAHEVACCNFEGPVESKSSPILKRGINLYQSKRTPEKLAAYGFNLISLANNHIMDYGWQGLNDTIQVFKNLGVPVFGAGFSDEQIYAPYYINAGDKKIAVLALCQGEFGVKKMHKAGVSGYAWISDPDLRTIIPKIKKNVDILIIFAHAGLEDVPYPLPEWQERYRYFIDLGADYVIGNHPHVIQGYEEYKHKFICYSLGNFIFDDENDEGDEYRRSLIVSIDTDKQDHKIVPVKFSGGFIEFDNSQQTLQDIRERSALLKDAKKLENWANSISEKLWKEHYQSYYELYNGQFVSDASYIVLIKAIIKKMLRYKKLSPVFDDTMLLHNIQIETHRWIVERYLYNQNIERNGL